MTAALQFSFDLLYPQCDGNPMAESTEQFFWIVFIKENVELLFADDENVFVAGDLLWYPVQVEVPPAPCQAPDTMVVFGRPKGKRRSYLQWNEDNIGPQVVFEILSASNRTREGRKALEYKFSFYEQYGVEEYYIYDPEKYTLVGYQRSGDRFIEIPTMTNWVSPRLKIRFEWQPRTELKLYRPDGNPFSSFRDMDDRVNVAKQETVQARQAAKQAEDRAEQAEDRAEQTLQTVVPRLLAFGMTVEEVAEVLKVTIEEVRERMKNVRN